MTNVRGIVYEDVTRLYWNKYPYKVVARAPFDFAAMMGSQPAATWVETRKNFKHVIKQAIPLKSEWKCMWNGINASFFFMEQADMDLLVSRMQRFVTHVYRPYNTAQLDLLQSNQTLVTRDMYFYGKYLWSITFNNLKDSEKDEVREWYKANFADDKEHDRSYFICGVVPKLYLMEDDDVLVTKLAFSHHIKKIEKAVLNSTLGKY